MNATHIQQRDRRSSLGTTAALPLQDQGNSREPEPHSAIESPVPSRKLIAYPFGYVYWLIALVLFVYAYYPSHTLKLLVEHWEFNDNFSQLHFHAGRLKDWLTI